MALNPEYHPANPDIPRPNLLADRVAIITGASRGIGRATAEAFAYHGAKAVVISSTEKSQQQAEEVLAVIRSYGAEGLWVGGQLEEKSTCEKLIEDTVDTFGHLHILVNNAGINRDRLFSETNIKDFDAVMNINFRPAVLIAQTALDYLLTEKDKATLIFMSSIAVHGNPGQANYAASKGALEGTMRSIAVELAQFGLRSNAIAPALVETDMAARLTPEQRQALIELCPYKRLISPSEIADLAVFLASDMSRAVNGQVINADGGMFR